VGQVVTGVVTKIAPFGAFARIEDGIEGLIHLSEVGSGVDPKAVLQEGTQLQLRILRIDAERRRLGLSLRQADELDSKQAAQEQPQAEAAKAEAAIVRASEEARTTEAVAPPSLESLVGHHEHVSSKGKSERRERQERSTDNSILRGLPDEHAGEMTAMAEAFRAAARQRSSKEETGPAEQ
jgi:small subunit ribosomal protein S1